MDRNLALEFVRVTEAAALAAVRWVGKGDGKSADRAATEAMRSRFNNIDFRGTIVIGEGERDKAPMLYIGEQVGAGKDNEEIDIAVDPLECTNSVANGMPNAISVFAAGPKGTLFHAPDMYMDQIAVGKRAAGKVHIDHSAQENIEAVAKAYGKDIDEVTVIMLDRPRHEKLIREVREAGARVRLITDGTIAAGMATSLPMTGVDMMLGIGAAPEGVITAAGLKCLDGFFQGRLQFRNDEEKARYGKMNSTDAGSVLERDELARGDNVMFAATGILDGPMLRGVVTRGDKVITHSIVMRSKTGTVRFLETHHKPE